MYAPFDPATDSRLFRRALGQFATGVTVITTAHPEHDTPVGLTISSFSTLSLSPPLVQWSLARQASSLPAFEACRTYVVHVLSADLLPLAARFAAGSQAARFDGVALTRSPSGCPMLADPAVAAWFECTHYARHDGGDHILLLGRVVQCHVQPQPALVHHDGRLLAQPAQPAPADSLAV